MQILGIFVLFALSAIVEGQLAAAARGLITDIILSVGTIYAAMNIKDNSGELDRKSWNEWRKEKFGPYVDIPEDKLAELGLSKDPSKDDVTYEADEEDFLTTNEQRNEGYMKKNFSLEE